MARGMYFWKLRLEEYTAPSSLCLCQYPPEISHCSRNRISVSSGKGLNFITNYVFLVTRYNGNYNDIVCLSITERQDRNDWVWVLGMLVRTWGKIRFSSKSLIDWLLSERDSSAKTFFNRNKMIKKIFWVKIPAPFSTIKKLQNVQMRF